MPREDETYRNIHGHPPYCTCVACTKKRLAKLETCPSCRQKALFWNYQTWLFECLNPRCARRYTKYGYYHGGLSTTKLSNRKYEPTKEFTTFDESWNSTEGIRPSNQYVERIKSNQPYIPPSTRYYTPRKRRWPKVVATIILLIIAIAIIGTYQNQIATFFLGTTPTEIPDEPSSPPPTLSTILPPISSSTETSEGFLNFTNTKPPYSVSDISNQVNLVNNPNATNPTWQQLLSFINTDQTDKKTYNYNLFPCGAFAEELHNNAEAIGIKSAWVAIDFSDNPDGHACNAFQTTDYGLIFIDCTGTEEPLIATETYPGEIVWGETNNWDTVAYIEIGKAYGIIEATHAGNYGLNYSSYQEWQQDIMQFDSTNASYTQQVGNRTYVTEAEYYQLQNQLDALDILANKIGAFYISLGTVSNVEIYW